MFDRVMGSCQRLANGNTLIVDSERGAAIELAPNGAPAWTYDGTQQTPDGHRVKIIRMRKVPASLVAEWARPSYWRSPSSCVMNYWDLWFSLLPSRFASTCDVAASKV